MRILTEFIIISEDIDMPNEEEFCPSMWKQPNFDSDGNFYFDFPHKKWSYLTLEVFNNNVTTSSLELRVCRETKDITIAASSEEEELSKYIEMKKEGRFGNYKDIKDIKSVAITQLEFTTLNIEGYKEFLNTVHFYLTYTNGFLINYGVLDANRFLNMFLKPHSLS